MNPRRKSRQTVLNIMLVQRHIRRRNVPKAIGYEKIGINYL
jgi:hypothetical protein